MKYLLIVIVLLLLLTKSGFGLNLVCPQGWTKLYEICYRVFPLRSSWVYANEACQRYGGKLAEPSGYFLTNNVSDLVVRKNQELLEYYGDYDVTIPSEEFLIDQAWIGYNRRGYAGSDSSIGYWSDSVTTSADAGMWGSQEPNVDAGECTYIDITDRKWYMKSCDFLLPAVCQLVPCPENTFRCFNGLACIDLSKQCNNVDDCGDHSDERDCAANCRSHLILDDDEESTKYPSGFGNYPALTTCEWNIEGPPGHYIQIQLESLRSEKYVDYLEFWEGEPTWYEGTTRTIDRLSGTLPQNDNYELRINRNNFLTVRFASDHSVEYTGFTFTSRIDFKCQWIRLKNRKMVYGQETSNCENVCLDDQNCLGRLVDTSTNKCYVLPEFSRVTENPCCELFIKTCPWTTGNPVFPRIPNMGGEVWATSEKQQLFSPFYPSLYPGNTEIAWIIRASGRNIINLQVLDVDICGSDQLLVKDGDNPVSSTLLTLTSSSVAGDIVMSTGNSLYLYFVLQEHLLCRGVLLTYQTGCNFEITSNNGPVATPAHGVKSYPPLLICTWLIRSASGRPLFFVFEEFDLNTNDFVQIYKGENDQGTGVYSGQGYGGSSSLPASVTAPGGVLFVVFQSRETSTNFGFRAKYSSDCQQIGTTGVRLTTHLSITVVECLTGYYFEAPYTGQSSVTLTCQDNGFYDQIIPKCTTSACPQQASTVAGGSVTLIYGDGTSPGSVYQYACGDTYELIGVPQIMCQTGSWSDNAPVCSKKKCTAPHIQNGNLINSGPFVEGDVLTVLCENGFYINGSNPFICSEYMIVPRCINVNECTQNPCQCLPGIDLCVTSDCVDTQGSYYCRCPSGHKYSASMGICEAVEVTETYYRKVEGESVTLNCVVHTRATSFVVTWTKDGNVVDTSLSNYQDGDSANPSLTISPLATSDIGYYICSVSANTITQNGYIIQLFVRKLGAATVDISSDTLNAAYTGSIEVPCSISITSYTSLSWYFNGTLINIAAANIAGTKYEINESNGVNRTDVKLKIYSLNKTDIGYYQCQVVNSVGTSQSGLMLLNVIDNTNYCNPLPCNPQNFLVCTSVGFGEYTCSCQDGFYGDTCMEGSTDCNSYPCRHGGTCSPQSSGYTCRCPVGWTGQTCDTLIDECGATPCENSGTCLSLADDYVCLCTAGKTGKNCDQDYNPCATENPCVPSNVCIVDRGVATCDCSLVGAGEHCYTLTKSCNTIKCENAGSCDDSSGQAVCSCLPGYSGTYCEMEIDDCVNAECPTNSDCVDLLDDYWCKCKNGRIGENCDKALNGDLDLIITPRGGFTSDTTVTESALFDLDSQALTISLWFRYTSVTSPGTIFSLYSLSSKLSTPVLLTELTGTSARTFIDGAQDYTSITTDVKDGAWHHYMLSWDGISGGRLVLYLDGNAITTKVSFGTSAQLPTYGLVLFGATYSAGQIVREGGLIGRISRFFLLKSGMYPISQSLLLTTYAFNTENVIMDPVSDAIQRNGAVVDYVSQLTNNVCTEINNDCSGIIMSTLYPSYQFCPGDQLKVTDGASSLSWTEALFDNSVDSVDKNYISGQDTLGQGLYGIVNIGYDDTDNNGNAAVCVYRLYVRSSSCASIKPDNPLGGTQSCASTPTGERCYISCLNDGAIATAGSVYYSCSLYSVYGQSHLQQKYVYPACADSVDRKYHLIFSAAYSLTSCDDSIAENLRTFLRTTFTTLSGEWNADGYGLCGTVCGQMTISISCTSITVATIQADFGLIKNPLTNALSETKDADDVLIDGVSLGSFDFSTGATTGKIDPTSIQVGTTPSCYGDYPQLIGSQCVQCGQGMYHDLVTSSCLSCPRGQYQDAVGQSTCNSCSVGRTTYIVGAISQTSCYQACSSGKYFNLTNSECKDCPKDTYQTSTATLSCVRCPSGLETSGEGSASLSDCYDPALTTTASSGGGSVGAATAGIQSGILVAIILGCLLVLIAAIVLFSICCFRDRISCTGKEKVAPEEQVVEPYVRKYEETNITFVSYRLDDIREKRGLKSLEKRPIMDDARSISTDISVHVPLFMETLNGHVSKKQTFVSNLAPSENFMENETLPVKEKKRRKKKKRRTPKHIPDSDELPRTATPGAENKIPKALPKLKKPSKTTFEPATTVKFEVPVADENLLKTEEVDVTYAKVETSGFKSRPSLSHEQFDDKDKYRYERETTPQNMIAIDSDEDMR